MCRFDDINVKIFYPILIQRAEYDFFLDIVEYSQYADNIIAP